MDENVQIDNRGELPKGLKLEQWYTEEKDLPAGPTEEIFFVRAIYVDTKEIVYSFAKFLYCLNRKPVDYDEWQMIDGISCFARESDDNDCNVVAWAKVKIDL
jgi:hypothetical protein